MWHHVYPHWHKTAQRCFFFLAVILLITLPVVYGKHHSISSKVLGSVLGVFFAIWIAFSVLRFLVPSPVVESTLPIYTHSPIPDPVVLYSPTRSDAIPAAPAIRLHPSSAATPRVPGRTGGARFADDPVDSNVAAGTGNEATATHNNVTFQTRPRGNTADSTSSFAYPTFAVYRQAQHVNFDAFAQRVKRAFALSQQQQQRELEEQELQKQQRAQQQDEQDGEIKQQHPLSLDQQRPSNSRSNSTSAVPSSTLATNAPGTGTRSRSSSAASMMSDFAERLKAGKLFRRSSNLSLRATAVANAAASETGANTGAGVSSSTLSKRPSNQQLKSNNTVDDAELLSAPLAPSGIEIKVTPSEDDHPSTDNAHVSTATATTGSAPTTTTTTVPTSTATSV
ncbi:hypothetical protein BG015_001528 [Linnemannia schmuckeri]|uniref:Uncharacterized protein n=1 Tax=Linnemannia schmuckeri TaxID=64567 RepID=A0A9P5RPN1_9FUNG|nr:hypothetical protein BG015_001528 [Linnemannia schmuckeri]